MSMDRRVPRWHREHQALRFEAKAKSVLEAYSFQSFSVGEVFTAAKASQIEVNIRDHVHGVSSGLSAPASNAARVKRTAGDMTTTSTSLTDLTGATATLTTAANPALVGQSCTATHSASDGFVTYNVVVDGTVDNGTTGITAQCYSATALMNMSFMHPTAVLSAASHTLKMQWKTTAGTATTSANAGTAHTFHASEMH
jgi:hypothetical protein